VAQSYGWQAIKRRRTFHGERSKLRMAGQDMFYTYVIQSLSHPDQRYIGHTTDLRERLADHNAGKCSHSSKFRPWKIKFYAAFESIEQAQHFEKYLKSGSGHAFAKRHLWSHGLSPES